MRYSTIIISLDEQIRSTTDQQLRRGVDDPRAIWIDGSRVATQEAIHYINLLDDGSVVGVAQFRGDAAHLARIQEDVPHIISSTVTGGETWLGYMHYEPGDVERAILERLDSEAISIDWPMRETDSGLQVTLFGDDAAVQHLITALSEDVSVSLERKGEYEPEIGDPGEHLTDRQTEIVRTALAAGYYDIPRRATQRDLAAELGVSRGTIGDHLRRAESKIIRAVLQ
ncbi:bacterio-opsin activator (plasmid) [Salinigranum rubrum]|uniref:Bacterio-opsin activator n=1 Tax=Salinigranum rubrum TaxID=755307 RepID=A0A2I8VQD7_9EURY|nr:helix-turn-helix domain-containing protein [Salinigranum rubrum]AUV84094.1 bacterio-opsin activator [Salinigranum rubrum]